MAGLRGVLLLPPLFFVAVAVLKIALVVHLGNPTPTSPFQDVNVYLELAMNLWQDGVYETRVAERTYPPGYPMFLAPTFAIASNATRFGVIYGLHSLLMAGSLLLLLPMLSESLGRSRAWLALAILQCMFGATAMQMHAQSEAMFAPFLVAATGLAWSAWRAPSARRFLLLGLVAGFCFVIRRLGVVVPIALVCVLVWELYGARGDERRAVIGRARWVLLGIALSLLPDLVVILMRGEHVQTYSGYAAGYASTTGRALATVGNGVIAVQTLVRQFAYLALITLAAPALLAAVVVGRQRAVELQPPAALLRTAGFVGTMCIGFCLITTIHILRNVFNLSLAKGHSVYPRYMDPMEVPLLAVGIVAAVWLMGLPATASLRRRVLPWLGVMLALGALAGPWYRTRAGRLVSARYLEKVGLGDIAPAAFGIAVAVVVVLAVVLWVRGRYGTLGGLVVALVLSWMVSWPIPMRWMAGVDPPSPPQILLSEALAAKPEAALCVLAKEGGNRRPYEVAFRSEHPVRFVPASEVKKCAREHPDGFVLGLKKDRWTRHSETAQKTKTVATDRRWKVWRSVDIVQPQR